MRKIFLIGLITAFLISAGCWVCFGEDSAGTDFTFVLPPSYTSTDDAIKKEIPADKPVMIYLVSEADLDAFDKGEPFRPELTLRGVTQTGGATLRFKIPEAMIGHEYAVLTLVILDTKVYPDFDLKGQKADFKVDAPDRIITGIAKESENFFTAKLIRGDRTFTFDLMDA